MYRFVLKRAALIIGVVVFSFSVALFGINTATNAQQGGGSGLSISPTRTELVIEPGKSDVVKLSLRNVSGQDVTAKVIVNDFQSDGVSGEPKILVDADKDSPYSIKPFLKNVKNLDMKKDEKIDFEFPVEIPANTAPGAYYGVVRYTAVPFGDEVPQDNKVALTASVGSLVLIEVPGNITEQIQVRSMKVLKDDKAGSFFATAPNKVAIEIKNNGNSFSKPFGRVVVYRGDKEVHSYELNDSDPKSNILPASVRTFTDDIQNIKTPGQYKVVANLSHGRGGEILTHSASFWYVPTYVLIVLLVLLGGAAAAGYLLYRKKFAPRKRSGR